MLKGLAMELVCASILRRLTNCPRVVAWAKTQRGVPHVAAGGGSPDITGVFPGTPTSPPFRLLMEVSANRVANEDHFKKQIAGAYKHAEKEAGRFKDVRICALMVNGCRVYSPNQPYRQIYLEFVREKGLDAYSQISIVPLHALDFAVVMGRLFFEIQKRRDPYHWGTIAKALDLLRDAMLHLSAFPNKRTWMVDMLEGAFKGHPHPNPIPKLDDEDDADGDGRDTSGA